MNQIFKTKEFWQKNMGEAWADKLGPLLVSDLTFELMNKVAQHYNSANVFPDRRNIFRAFRVCPPENLKVIILGQDPYHDVTATEDGYQPKATGLAFANPETSPGLNPSLRIIKRRVEHDFSTVELYFDKTFMDWAKQGVLLLNTALTVEQGKPGSHTELWEIWTKKALLLMPKAKAFLWGAKAAGFSPFFSRGSEVLICEHPAYAARKGRLWDCDHFIKTPEIEWRAAKDNR